MIPCSEESTTKIIFMAECDMDKSYEVNHCLVNVISLFVSFKFLTANATRQTIH